MLVDDGVFKVEPVTVAVGWWLWGLLLDVVVLFNVWLMSVAVLRWRMYYMMLVVGLQ